MFRRSVKKTEECILLYVEDDDAAAYLFETALRDEGINVQFFRVTDGDQATEFVLHTGDYESAPTPDLVVLDLNLPRKSGFDVLAEIRQSYSLHSLPVVIFSTSTLPCDRNKALELGADKYLAKAGDLDEFFTAVRSMCKLLPTGPILMTA